MLAQAVIFLFDYLDIFVADVQSGFKSGQQVALKRQISSKTNV
jgi:hypothetical protein